MFGTTLDRRQPRVQPSRTETAQCTKPLPVFGYLRMSTLTRKLIVIIHDAGGRVRTAVEGSPSNLQAGGRWFETSTAHQ
jgi:hypothetical protein